METKIKKITSVLLLAMIIQSIKYLVPFVYKLKFNFFIKELISSILIEFGLSETSISWIVIITSTKLQGLGIILKIFDVTIFMDKSL